MGGRMRGTFSILLSLTRRIREASLIGAAGLLVAGAFSARGDVSFPVTFGGGGNSFSATMNANLTYTVSGSGTLDLNSPPIAGTPVGLLSAHVDLPSQTGTFNAGLNLTSTPTGNGTIRLSDNWQGSDNRFPAGADGKADAGLPGNPANAYMQGTVDALNVTLLQHQQAAGSQIQLNGSASFNVLGLIPVSVPLRLSANPTLALDNFMFNQLGSSLGAGFKSPTYGDNNHPYLPNTLDLSSQYPFNVSAGTFTGQASGNLAASMSTTILGIDVGLGNFNIPINSQALSLNAGIIGDAHYIEVPTPNTLADDLRFTLGGDLSSLLGGVALPLDLSGSLPINQVFNLPLSLGFLGTINFTATFNGSASYNISGSATISSIQYQLQSQDIANAVNVPEVSSLALMGLTAAGGLVAAAYRRRKLAA